MAGEPNSQPSSSSPAPAAAGDATAQGRKGSSSKFRGRWWLEITIAVVIAVGAIVATYAVVEMSHKSPSSGSGGMVLVPAGTLYPLSPDQYDALIFAQKSASNVAGTITNAGGAQLYVMTPGEYFTLVNTYNITGYEWTSGPIATGAYYGLDVTIPVGSWDLVFASSVPDTATAIGIYSNLVENP